MNAIMNPSMNPILIKFAVTFLLALLFGFERQRSHKPIGFGTFVFVAIGACGLTIAALSLSDEPLPLLGAIVTGIGFLGAGALIKTTDKIFGFTTAASIWVFAIIGVIIGLGEYFIALSIYLLIWFVIVIDNYMEIKGLGSYQKKITISADHVINKEDLISILGTKKYKILSMEKNTKTNQFSMILFVAGSKKNINEIPKRLHGKYGKEWKGSFKIE
ncbi:MAG: MgtC/SapB family protein [Nanoarchaeota archaeon]|nr:MgtC/SapB family protein [Nanoarchaeota archaeon]